MFEKTRVCSNPNCEFSGSPQPLGSFYKDKSNSLGVSYHCKSCNNLHKKQARANEKDREKVYDECYRLLMAPAIDKAISNLISESIELSKAGTIKNKRLVKENSTLIFKLGLIR